LDLAQLWPQPLSALSQALASKLDRLALAWAGRSMTKANTSPTITARWSTRRRKASALVAAVSQRLHDDDPPLLPLRSHWRGSRLSHGPSSQGASHVFRSPCLLCPSVGRERSEGSVVSAIAFIMAVVAWIVSLVAGIGIGDDRLLNSKPVKLSLVALFGLCLGVGAVALVVPS
jgi:hypothetical protein